MIEIPKAASDFTIEWLNTALADKLGNSRVIGCDARDSDIPGQTAEIVLLDVQYDSSFRDNGASLPKKYVAKITSRDPKILQDLIAFYDQYRRESSFYREFPDIGISVPRCLYEQHKTDPQQLVILMEDLAPSESPSWAVSLEQVETAIGALPTFHGKWWNQEILRQKDWMVQYDNRDFYGAAYHAANEAGATLASLYDDPSLTREIMAFCFENQDSLMAFIESRPFTFVHGDYHAKQMFFPTEQGGKFAVIDWQFPFVAQGAWDFARMVGMCLDTQVRQENEASLLDNYHEGLISAGISGYDRSQLEMDYRMGLIISQMIMCVASADTDIALIQKECEDLGLDWKDVSFNRTQSALEEWGALDFLKAL
ncbi:MAG: oxidoreductase family protein [Pseudomonadales bacterium]